MKLSTLAVLATTAAFPVAALAQGGSSGGPSAGPSSGSSNTTGAAADSSRLPPSPGVSQNAPGRHTQKNGAAGDPGNTGSDSGTEASDEVAGSAGANIGQNTAPVTTGNNVGPREPGDNSAAGTDPSNARSSTTGAGSTSR
jgi:hypothetical protein